nr:FAD-dependent oxidoreductase [Pseudozobellia thermophila]
MLDYLIVGLGLAGISFAERLDGADKTFKVVSDRSQTSSRVAGGLYNPVILKRFTLAWKADVQLQGAKPFYAALEAKLGSLDHPFPVYRRLSSIEEQNMWFEASDKMGLGKFLSPTIHPNTHSNIDAPLGFGEVLHTGRIDTNKLVDGYTDRLAENDRLLAETFDYAKLHINERFVEYKGIRAGKIVFAEGFGMKGNPFFNYLPLNGSKGEYLVVKAVDLKIDFALKSSVFVIPLGNDLYQVGANYEWRDKTNEPTQRTKEALEQKLGALISCDYEVVGQLAGVRPTVSDRRPLVGRHPEHKNLYVLNGFGSRGVLIAPYASRQLLDFIEEGIALDAEMDIRRFDN